MQIPAELIDRVTSAARAAAQAHFGERLVSVVLYGSCARGTATEASDVDLLIIAGGLSRHQLDRGYDREAIFQAVHPLLLDIRGRTGWYPYLSILLYTPEEADRVRRLYFDMVEEARILHDRDGFFQRVLDRTAARLQALGARRVWVGRKWYWDLKPDFKPGDKIEL